MMNLLPRHFASTLAGLVLLGMLFLLTACDDDTVAPRVTVPEIDAPQPAEVLLEVPTDEASATSDDITVEYRGLDGPPDIEATVDGPGSVEVTNRSNSGDPFENGTTTFALAFTYPDASTIDPSEATVTVSGSSAELNRSASQTLNVDVQKVLPEITAASTSLSFEIPGDQTTSETREFVVSYRALDEAPSFTLANQEGPGTFNIVEGATEGSPADGSTTYEISYESTDVTVETTADLVFEGANALLDLEESLTVGLTGSGELFGVDGEDGVLTDFLNVADYEERTVTDFGGATSSIVADAPAVASGSKSLSLAGETGSGVTLANTIALEGADRFTFYARGDAGAIVDLVWTFRDDAGDEAEFTQSLERGQPWLLFEVPAADAGLDALNGTLAEIDVEIQRPAAGTTVEVFIDDLNFADENGTLFSFFDFDSPSFIYGVSPASTQNVASESFGSFAGRYTVDGDTNFGFNYDLLRFPEANLNSDILQFRVGDVTGEFTLTVFVETFDDIGGWTFDNRVEVPLTEISGWETIDIQLSDLGNDASALVEQNGAGAIRNVGFVVEEVEDELSFSVDDLVIRRGN